MQYYIDFKSGIPIYVQLIEQIKEGIASGLLEPGDRLPTVRELALKLTVNPNTVARSYKELEREGLIETKRGVGSFVAQNPEITRAASEEEIDKMLDELINKAFQLGIPRDLLEKKVSSRLQEKYNRGGDRG